MSRSEQIIPEKYVPLTQVKRGSMATRLPHKFADKNLSLARASTQKKEGRP